MLADHTNVTVKEKFVRYGIYEKNDESYFK